MFYKAKYQGALKTIEELKDKLRQNDVAVIERQWQMMCRINELIKENEKLEKKIRQYGEIGTSFRDEKRTKH